MNKSLSIHGSAIAIDKEAIIIIGPSGSGKSDLSLRLIDRGAQLIADDLVIISGNQKTPILSQSTHHINAIEIRGIGIIPMHCVNDMPLKLIVQIRDNYKQNPAPLPLINYDLYHIPCITISPFEISAPIKIEQALINLQRLTNIADEQ